MLINFSAEISEFNENKFDIFYFSHIIVSHNVKQINYYYKLIKIIHNWLIHLIWFQRDDSLSEEFPSPAATIVTSLTKEGCSYLAACLNFKFELGLPETFFLPYTTICLCDNCYIYSNKSLTTNVLPQQQILPLLSELHAPGWCIFPLKTSPIVNLNPGGVGGASAPTLNNNSNNINSNNSLLYKWHPAFYPCRLEHVRTILDNGQLLLPGKSWI